MPSRTWTRESDGGQVALLQPEGLLSPDSIPARRATRGDDPLTTRGHLAQVLIFRILEIRRKALETDRDIKSKRKRFYYGSVDEVVHFLVLRPGQRLRFRPPDDRSSLRSDDGDP